MHKNKENKISHDIFKTGWKESNLKKDSVNFSIDDVKELIDYLVLQKVKLNIQDNELHKLREKLESTYHEFVDLYDFNPVSYLTLNQDWEIRAANISAANLLGKNRDTLVGSSFDNFIPDRFKNIFYDSCNEITDNNLAKSFELKLIGTGQREVYVHLIVSLDFHQNDNRSRYKVAIRDINSRKELENKLEEYNLIVQNLIAENKHHLEGKNENTASRSGKIDDIAIGTKSEEINLEKHFQLRSNFDNIICQSEEFNDVLRKVEQVAATDMTVLVQGETGTGKELVARALHALSGRRERPLIKLDCTTLPSNLIESELFGHEKGAFTGAYNKKMGRFEIANKGTIFLDEIGELPLGAQSKLLRILQEGEFERLGSSETFKIDVRVIAATNRDLEKEIEKGNFREDLYYRLNVYPINLPPLRKRVSDITLLTKYFIKMYNKKLDRNVCEIPQDILEMLKSYPWPGNVRELKNIIERGVLISKGRKLRLFDSLPNKCQSANIIKKDKTLEELERDYILEVLDTTDWKIGGKGGAAEILGIKRTTLYEKMKRLGIEKPNK